MRFLLMLSIVSILAVNQVYFSLGTLTSGYSYAGDERPLYLPSGGGGGNDEEEDAPEAIRFYGSEFEANTIVFIVPAYGFCGETDIFGMIRQEVSTTLNQLSAAVDFALVAYNSTTYIWRPDCVHAAPGHKAAAQAWTVSLAPIDNPFLFDSALTGLGLPPQASCARKQLIPYGAR